MKAENSSTRDLLPESASVLLDFVRLTLAILVVIGHVTFATMRLGYVDRRILGEASVPIFFVLSGFVIRYVSKTRESNAREYFIDRASRIYSVAVPAILFSLAAGGICYLLDRSRFLSDWSAVYTHPVLRLLLNLSFLSQAWGHNTIPFLNAPFWSLGYECVYYAFYGFIFFLRGWKRILSCVGLAVLIGPQVLFLFPIWWLGCWAYDLYAKVKDQRLAMAIPIAAGIWLTAGLALCLTGRSSLLRLPIALDLWVARLPNPLTAIGLTTVRANMAAVAVGVVSTPLLFTLLLAMDFIHISRTNRWAKRFRRVADGTFAIYLLHDPFLILLTYLGLLRAGHWFSNPLVVAAMCVVMIAAAFPMDHLKRAIRRWLGSRAPKGTV